MDGLREPLLAAEAAEAPPRQQHQQSHAEQRRAPGPAGSGPAVAVVVEEEDGLYPLLSRAPPRARRSTQSLPEGAAPGAREAAGGQEDTFKVCAFNLAKVILGAGMMAMPKAMYMLGVVPGSLLMLAIALMSYYTLARGLIHSSDALGARSYAALVARTLGPRAEGALQVAVFVTCWVMEVVFLVVIADILVGQPPEYHGLLRELLGGAVYPPLTSRPAVLGVLCAAVLFPLGSMHSMDRLAVVNIIGVASNGVLAALMVALLAGALARGATHPLPLWPQWGEAVAAAGGRLGAALMLASTVPVVLNCFACHQSLHPLLPSLRPYSTRRAQGMVATSLAIAGVLYYIIAICACAVFGPSLHDDILSDISAAAMAPLLGSPAAAHAAALVVRVGYLLSLTGSFTLLLFPLRHVIADVALGGHAPPAAEAPPPANWLASTGGIVATAYLTACFLPGIWGALSLTGATATTAQAWIIPALLILALEPGGCRRRRGKAGGGPGAVAPLAEEGGGGGGAGGEEGKAGEGGAAASAARRAAAGLILAVGVVLFANAFVTAFISSAP